MGSLSELLRRQVFAKFAGAASIKELNLAEHRFTFADGKGYPYRMSTGLKIAYLWHDSDVIEVRVTAENAGFRGTADVYVGTDGLIEAAATLAGFPKDSRDKREVVFGAQGKQFAGGAVRLEFYCSDLAGHAAFRAMIEGDYGQMEIAESATVYIEFEPAALDQFVVELQRIGTEHQGSASLLTVP